MKKLLNCKKGSMHIALIFIVIFLLGAALIGIEIFRINGINQHLNDELYRATNLAVKTAMYDSWRQDHISKFDNAIAYEAFYDYLYNELKLNRNLEKYENGEEIYNLTINEMNIDGENVRMNVKATATAKSIFNFWSENWIVPIDVTSRNMRVD